MITRQSLPYLHLDVFTDQPFGGNQLAVFTDARGLEPEAMQRLAREINFAESAFVLPAEAPAAARRVRIFSPAAEMPFAGHPVIGTAFALAAQGALPLDGPLTTFRLQLNIGLMPITIAAENDRPAFVWMEQRPAYFGATWDDHAGLADALGLEAADIAETGWPAQVVSTGVPYLMVPVRSLEALHRARPGSPALRDRLLAASRGGDVSLSAYVFTRQAESAEHTAQARMFSPDYADPPEDAATGSAAGPLGAYLVHHGLTPPGRLLIEQGYAMGRPSRLHVEVTENGRIAVGGQAVIVGEGTLYYA